MQTRKLSVPFSFTRPFSFSFRLLVLSLICLIGLLGLITKLVLPNSLIAATVAVPTVRITEIMYDPDGADTDREWLEIYNQGGAAFDVSDLYLIQGGSRHAVSTETAEGKATIPAGGFAVIAQKSTKFILDYPEFSGLLFHASFSLKNTGDDLALELSDGTVLDSIRYVTLSEANGTGQSLQAVNQIWQAALVTPGKINIGDVASISGEDSVKENENKETDVKKENTELNNSTQDNTPDIKILNNVVSSGSTTSTSSVQEFVYNFSLNIPQKVMAHTPVILSTKSNQLNQLNQSSQLNQPSQATLNRGIFFWNFGDGQADKVFERNNTAHRYEYSGKYIVTLAWFSNSFESEPKYILQTEINVYNPEIALTRETNTIFLKNEGTEKINLSDFYLGYPNGNKIFIPPYTFILPDERIHLPCLVGLTDPILFYSDGNKVLLSS